MLTDVDVWHPYAHGQRCLVCVLGKGQYAGRLARGLRPQTWNRCVVKAMKAVARYIQLGLSCTTSRGRPHFYVPSACLCLWLPASNSHHTGNINYRHQPAHLSRHTTESLPLSPRFNSNPLLHELLWTTSAITLINNIQQYNYDEVFGSSYN